jgi:hypothetical protein
MYASPRLMIDVTHSTRLRQALPFRFTAMFGEMFFECGCTLRGAT